MKVQSHGNKAGVMNLEVDDGNSESGHRFLSNLARVLRMGLFSVLSVGPIPSHIAFIMDGNRRYAKRKNLIEGTKHDPGFSALIDMLKYCFELGVKNVTVFAFSIENFRRSPEEVQNLMLLLQRKMEDMRKKEGFLNQYEVRIIFAGNLKLLTEQMREAAERLMRETSKNGKMLLSVCLAYTSTDEITHAIQVSSEEYICQNGDAFSENGGEKSERFLSLGNIEKHMYMTSSPDPDIIIRTSGETRLSNFLLWQSAFCLLYSPTTLWPEIGVWHLVCTVINFQRNCSYLEKKKKQS